MVQEATVNMTNAIVGGILIVLCFLSVVLAIRERNSRWYVLWVVASVVMLVLILDRIGSY